MNEKIITIRVYTSADEDCMMENIANPDDRLYAEHDYWIRMSDVMDMVLKLQADLEGKADIQQVELAEPKQVIRKNH